MLIKRIFSALFAVTLLLSPHPGELSAQSDGESAYPDVFRLHVIANSDGEADQEAKLAVRDAVLALETKLSRCTDAASAKAAVMADGGLILDEAERVLQSLGMDYGAQLIMGEFDFPERTYAGKTYPAGRYEALRIVLGSGNGHNWWCVMFPPLCILELPGGQVDYDRLDDGFDIGKMRFTSLIAKLIKSIDGGRLWERITQK